LTRHGDNPPHDHEFITAGENGINLRSDSSGGVLFARFRGTPLLRFLDNLYRFEDRATAQRWRGRLLPPDPHDFAWMQFGKAVAQFNDREFPTSEPEWRQWWRAHSVELEHALFAP
jgi:hypothetical protein